MSLQDLHCCQGRYVTAECNECPNSPRYITRRDIQIADTRQIAKAAFEDLAKRAMTEGAHSALTLVEIGLQRGLSAEEAIRCAREGTDVWGVAG